VVFTTLPRKEKREFQIISSNASIIAFQKHEIAFAPFAVKSLATNLPETGISPFARFDIAVNCLLNFVFNFFNRDLIHFAISFAANFKFF